MQFFNGRIILTEPVSIAGSVAMLDKETYAGLVDKIDNKKLLELVRKKLIVKQIMDSKEREKAANDNPNFV